MSSVALKGIGCACFVLCAAMLFAGWQEYETNVKATEAFNRMTQSPMFGGESPLGDMMKQMTGKDKVEPGVPGSTVGALTLAALFGIGGVTCLIMARKKSQPSSAAACPPTQGGAQTSDADEQ